MLVLSCIQLKKLLKVNYFYNSNWKIVALESVQALGGNGYTNEYPVARILRDAKLYEIGAGTSEIRRALIGRELFNETE